jgi:hypothetical protein
MSAAIRIFAALVIAYHIFVPSPQLAQIGATIALLGLTGAALTNIND